MEDIFKKFNQDLESWYKENQRSFPWRTITDPYQIWISEVMSHQTQIERVADFFWPRFIKKFPTIEELAKSSWEEVYEVWDGLGYYSRGKNMLKAAKIVVKKHEGHLPITSQELEKLPGVGAYTAAAILAFAFDQKVPAVDTNISKIISALWPDEDIHVTAKNLVENSNSGKNWNSAMMDLGSAIRAGKKIEGSLGEKFFTTEILEKFFAKKTKSTVKKKKDRKFRIDVGAACIWQDGKYLVQSRPEGKSFVGFWEFPGGKREKGENFRDCVKREVMEEIGVHVSVRPHFYEELCHFKNVDLCLRFHRAQIQKGVPRPLENQTLKWIKPEDFFSEKFLPTNHEVLKKLQKMRV